MHIIDSKASFKCMLLRLSINNVSVQHTNHLSYEERAEGGVWITTLADQEAVPQKCLGP